MADSHAPISIDERYIFTAPARRRLVTYLIIGLILFIAGVLLLKFFPPEAHGGGGEAIGEHAAAAAHGGGHEESAPWLKRLFANLWLNSVFFTGIAVMGLFFVAVQYVAYAGWSSSIKRIPESFGAFLPFTGVLMLILFFLGGHDLFHWTHDYLYEEYLGNKQPNPDYDEIIAGKRGFLNTPFFVARMLIYFGAWFLLFWQLRKESLREDLEGGLAHYNRSKVLSAIFIVIFAVTSSTSAWDWVMSIDTHWFSTMFGWYVFASWFISGLSTITLVVVLLKEQGYLKVVNQNHLHDLGKFMFAFSIFWTYIWFAQFLLIYYANIPEESIYFLERLHGYENKYTAIVFINLFINFAFPFLVLMTRDSKRQMVFLKVVAGGLLIGHWLDFYLMIMPGTVGSAGGIGITEFGAILLFASAFVFVVSATLSKAALIAKNHPMLEESLHHDI